MNISIGTWFNAYLFNYRKLHFKIKWINKSWFILHTVWVQTGIVVCSDVSKAGSFVCTFRSSADLKHFRWSVATDTAPLFVTSGLPMQAVVTQDSPNDIMVLMNFNWEEILTCRPNCIWLKTILVLLLANWSGRVGWAGVFWQDRWCPCGNILKVFQVVPRRWNKSTVGGWACKKKKKH